MSYKTYNIQYIHCMHFNLTEFQFKTSHISTQIEERDSGLEYMCYANT